jgi:broad specificity phosphatase PhoE
MARVHLVRHGRASAGWDRDRDPSLDAIGEDQAVRVAERLAPLAAAGLISVVTSPLRRCRQTAAPLARRWGVTPTVEDTVAEIPSPPGVPMVDRVEWLREAMAGSWSDLGDRYLSYRDEVVDFVIARAQETVVFSHFIAINAVLGACLGDDRLVIRRLDNTSITVVDVDAGTIRLVEPGHEADTLIR